MNPLNQKKLCQTIKLTQLFFFGSDVGGRE